MSRSSRASLIAALMLALALTACGSAPTDTSETRTVVITKTVAEPASEPVAAEEPVDETAAKPVADDRAESSSGTFEVPDVVGEDHQLAQDTMQAAGLYNLAEEDATGQGRALLFDRNWTVVSQSPAPGSMVAEDATITLRSKKDGE
jgi:hypothetical protein